MPIEIKELHIKAVVENAADASASAQGGSGGDDASEQLIKACVERVMELIKDEKER